MTASHQVGELNSHASLWSGTPQSRVELSEAASAALAIAGNQQVGWTFAGIYEFAAMWRGSSASYVNLHPTGALTSVATATDGTLQGGYVAYGGGTSIQAVLWNGSSTPIAFLNPPASSSRVLGMVPGQQVGWTQFVEQNTHAALWSGSAESWIDLNPAGSVRSVAHATAGSVQAGLYYTPGSSFSRACVWYGTPESVVNLHALLPPGYLNSVAYAVSVVDGITYVGGIATRDFQRTEAFCLDARAVAGAGGGAGRRGGVGDEAAKELTGSPSESVFVRCIPSCIVPYIGGAYGGSLCRLVPASQVPSGGESWCVPVSGSSGSFSAPAWRRLLMARLSRPRSSATKASPSSALTSNPPKNSR
ncbi:MAG: hypothetical protein ACKVW3_05560 [Phycisphaerales bacterium]